MQWLTAILAFATTMLVFAVIVTALVETIHRIFQTRTRGLQHLLGHFYDEVLQKRLQAAGVDLDRQQFLDEMTRVRATSHGWFRWCFRRLSQLPTTAMMERLGSTSFANVLKDDEAKRKTLLRDIAQKYETIGQESSSHFESGARVLSVFVAGIVAWTFYVHPYDLIQSYMKNPEVAVKVAALADDSMETYQKLVDEAEQLKKQQSENGDASKPSDDDVEKLFKKLKADIDTAKVRVDELSTAGAAVGWPDDPSKAKQSELFKKVGITVWCPTTWKDRFWLLMGGLLIGLGAPFWAKLVSQLTQAQGISQTLTSILKPPSQSRADSARGADATAETPVTTEAFLASADARAMADESGPKGAP